MGFSRTNERVWPPEHVSDIATGDLNRDGLTDLLVGRSLCQRYDAPCRIQVFLGSLSAEFVRGDTSDDGSLELTDAIRILELLFQGSSAPPAPYPDPGRDPTPDDTVCAP